MGVVAAGGGTVAAEAGPHATGHGCLHRDLTGHSTNAAHGSHPGEHRFRPAGIDNALRGELFAEDFCNETSMSEGAIVRGTEGWQAEQAKILQQRLKFTGAACSKEKEIIATAGLLPKNLLGEKEHRRDAQASSDHQRPSPVVDAKTPAEWPEHRDSLFFAGSGKYLGAFANSLEIHLYRATGANLVDGEGAAQQRVAPETRFEHDELAGPGRRGDLRTVQGQTAIAFGEPLHTDNGCIFLILCHIHLYCNSFHRLYFVTPLSENPSAMSSALFLYLVGAIFGAIVGSFLNVVILRLPDPEQSIVFPGSHCPQCNTPLAWFENIPIFSYLVLRGRCRHCRATISPQYPLVEALTAAIAMALLARFQLTFLAAALFVFAAALVVVIVIDIRLQIIPDLISLPGIVLGVLVSLIGGVVSWQSSLIGLFAGGGVLYSLALGYALLRKVEGMGGGDIKLLAMIGAWLGWQSLPFVILVSSLSGSLVGIIAMLQQKKGGQTRIPFGPFLSLAALLYVFFLDQVQEFYTLYLSGQWP